jgi:PII-like signaling protein
MAFILTSESSPSTTVARGDAVELTVGFGAARKVASRWLRESLLEECERRRLRVGEIVPAVEALDGSGQVRTELDEFDPPVVLLAVDTRAAIAQLIDSLLALNGDLDGSVAPVQVLFRTGEVLHELGTSPVQLTIHCRRGHTRHDPHGFAGVLDVLRGHGVAGATAIAGREGAVAGELHRRHLLSAPDDLPAVVITVDRADVLARVAPALLALDQIELMTVKVVALCKARGRRWPPPAATGDSRTLSRLTLYVGEDVIHQWRLGQASLIKRGRQAGARRVTLLRGRQGYALGDPLRPAGGWFAHGRSPMIAIVIDTPDRASRWFELIDDLTGDEGLLTHDFVTAISPTRLRHDP